MTEATWNQDTPGNGPAKLPATHHEAPVLAAGPWGRLCLIGGLLLLGAALGLAIENHQGLRPLCFAYLLNFAFLLSLSLGALIFVLLQHVTSARWSVGVRRLGEILGANVTTCVIMGIPVLLMAGFGHGLLYAWTDPAYLAGHQEIAQRWFYPNLGGFLTRLGIAFVAWTLIGRYFLRRSLQLDHSDETTRINLVLAMQRWSAPALVILGFTVAFSAFDLLMSLDPTWVSTIFGVYYFAGGMVGFLAVLTLVTAFLRRRANNALLLQGANREHFHDMGKLLFAFLFFWGYIAFSQYMLIWYGNIPDETEWFLRRGASTATGSFGPWTVIALVLLFGHLLIPFAALLSRFGKRRTWFLCFWAAWLLATHWLDLLWIVAPEYQPQQPAAALSPSMLTMDLLCLVGLGLLYLGSALRLAQGKKLIATGDPRLAAALEFHNI